MKKSLIVALFGLAFSASAQDVTSAAVIQPSNDDVAKPVLTLQYGIMHSDCKERIQAIQYVPSVLQGVSVASQWQVAEHSQYSHHVGFSVGYYTGSQTDIYYGVEKKSDVDVIPLLLTYNLNYHLNDKLVVYCGVRGGAVIRDTTFNYKSYKYETDDQSVNPMLGIGVGARALISKNWSFDIGYDFAYSFGNDCKVGAPDEHLTDYAEACEAPHGNRYYGTIKVGFSYSF